VQREPASRCGRVRYTRRAGYRRAALELNFAENAATAWRRRSPHLLSFRPRCRRDILLEQRLAGILLDAYIERDASSDARFRLHALVAQDRPCTCTPHACGKRSVTSARCRVAQAQRQTFLQMTRGWIAPQLIVIGAQGAGMDVVA